MSNKNISSKMGSNKPSRGIPVSKIPTSGRDSGTHSRSSSVSNLTTVSDIVSEADSGSHGFKLEDRVWVNGSKPGYIKFLGKAEFAPGMWAGVVLDEAVGKNDGSVSGVKYFTCEPMRGIFARPQKLTRSLGPLPASGDGMGSTASLKGAGVAMGSTASLKGAGLTTPSRNIATPHVSPGSTSRTVCSKLRLGERVVVSSTTGNKTGILRFIGETEFAKGEWAGIELDEPVGKNDGSVAGKRYFSCQVKYGLFSPMHKISRAGGTATTPRAPSVRGTPLMRSTSRDSISSSVSNCSKSSRVKLGVTSLANSQKLRGTGVGIMTTSRALEEALKEKEQHIEELLKEHDLGRTEFAKLNTRCEEIEAKCADFQNKEQQILEYKKQLEEQLATDKRKLEDLQFRLEEEMIVKSDLETQLQQKNNIFSRLDEFLHKASGEKFTNIKEILKGSETLSEVAAETTDENASKKLQDRIHELEVCITKLTEEKKKSLEELENNKSHYKESEKKTEEELFSLHNAVQEKDDVILNLRNELNLHLEKMTKLVADNQALAEQINFQASVEKENAEEVIKEFGEKVANLSEELKSKSSRLQELETANQEKDFKIAALEDNLKTQGQQFAEVQDLNQSLNQSFEQKATALTEKQTLQQSLETQVAALKFQVENEIPEKEKKILDLVKQIEQLTGSLQEKEEDLVQKKTEISDLRMKVDELSANQDQMKIKLKQAEENASLSTKDSTEKITSLQDENRQLNEKKGELEHKFDTELQKLISEYENVSNELETKNNILTEKESEIVNLKEIVNAKDTEYLEMQKMLTSVKEFSQSAINEKGVIVDNLKIKNEEFQTLLVKYEDLCKEFESNRNVLSEKETGMSTLVQKLTTKETEYSEIQHEVEATKKLNEKLKEEKELAHKTLITKEKLITDLEKELSNYKNLVEEKNSEASKNLIEIENLLASNKHKEEENVQVLSRLELAEQKVEMLNKDSSEHVMMLQNELSKLKEDSNKVKVTLEQNLTELQRENEKISKILEDEKQVVIEKENIISTLENEVKSKESNMSDLHIQIEKLNEDLIMLKKQKEEGEEGLQKQLLSTKEEHSSTLQRKEQDLIELQKDKETVSNRINEAKGVIAQKEEVILNLGNQLKCKEADVANFSEQIEKLQQKGDALVKEKEEMQESLQKQLLITKEGLSDELKQREQVVENSMSKISEYEKMLETSKLELSAKENSIAALKNTITEKESQFDELTKMIEASQLQLKQLNENNENNVRLLGAKETFINEFKAEMEGKLKEREENFKKELTNLEAILSGKEEITKQKDEIISKLTAHNQGQEKQIETLIADLEKNKLCSEKTQQNSESTHKEFTEKIADLESKYLKLMEEKEKIASEELKTRSAKKNLEEVRDTLIQEKVQQEEMVKDRETKLAALQVEVNRMQTDFILHKQELQQKLDVTLMEKEAALELKNELNLQHSVLEELQESLQISEDKCKKLELQCQNVAGLTSDKTELTNKIAEFERTIKEKSQKINDMEKKKQAAEELLLNSQNIILAKEKECISLKEQMQNLKKELDSKEQLKSTLKSVEEENKLLKVKMEMLAQSPTDKPSNKLATENTNQMDAEERDSLTSQIDFLNSIIVDMKQKNEELHREMEVKNNLFDESDLNLNEVKKLPPRLFCDICDMFDLHETDDCPKQESFIDDGEIPNLVPQGVRKFEERPYCNNCEVFGHWTLDCKEEQEF